MLTRKHLPSVSLAAGARIGIPAINIFDALAHIKLLDWTQWEGGRKEVDRPRLGACAMTTKFLDNKISTFKILLSWRFPRKQALLDDFPLCPQAPPPQKRIFYFYCRLAVSDRSFLFRDAPDTFNFLRHVMRAVWSVRPKCSHRCVSLKETP